MLSKNMSLVLGLRRIRLPIIQEEEGSIVTDGKSQLLVFGFDEEIESETTHKITTSKKKELKKENAKKQGKASPLKLPPLSGANYSRNPGPNQSLFSTSKNFRKNLITRKATNETKISANIKENHSPILKSMEKSGDKFENGLSLRPKEPLGSKTSTRVPSAKSLERSYGSSFEKTSLPDKTKKSFKLLKTNQNGSTKEVIKDKTTISIKTEEESKCYEVPKNHENAEVCIEEVEVCGQQPPSQSFFTRNETILIDSLKSDVRNDPIRNACELCEETFKTVEDLLTHKEKHEEEKEVCLICDKIFFSSKDFINHLLTHDGVSRFSCETCGKYFLSGKKYRDHCKEFHLLCSTNNAVPQIDTRIVEDSAEHSPPIHESKQSENTD